MTLPPIELRDFQAVIDRSPFHRMMGLTLGDVAADRQRLTIQLPFDARLGRDDAGQQMHGGPIAALIDVAGAALVGLNSGQPAATIDFHVDYLRPTHRTALAAEARVRKLGRKISIVDVNVRQADGSLVALGRARYMCSSQKLERT